MASSIAIVIGPTPPGTGVIAPATSLTGVEVDVADEPVVGAVGADVDHRRARLHHLGADQARRADRGDEDVGARADRGEVAGARVADGDRRVLAEQQRGERPADQDRAAEDHRLGALDLGAGVAQQLDHALRRARHEARAALGEQPGAGRR